MTLVRFMFWVVVITMEIEVCCKIGRRQWNYGNRQRSLGPVGRIFNWVLHFAKGEDQKKTKLHYEVAAMVGHELARYNLGYIDFLSSKKERASKHMKLAASAGVYRAMNNLLVVDFKQGLISRDEIDSILTAYNDSCAEMRSEARDAYILMKQETLISDLLLSTLLI